jgi:hypothetical protein
MASPLVDRRLRVVSEATFVLAGISLLLAQLAPPDVNKACRMSSFRLWIETQGVLPCLVAFARVEKAWIRVRFSARDAARHLCAAASVQPGVGFQRDLEGRVAGFLQLTDNGASGHSVPEAYLVRRSALQLTRAWRMSAPIGEARQITEESAELRDEEYMAGVDLTNISDSLQCFCLSGALTTTRQIYSPSWTWPSCTSSAPGRWTRSCDRGQPVTQPPLRTKSIRFLCGIPSALRLINVVDLDILFVVILRC